MLTAISKSKMNSVFLARYAYEIDKKIRCRWRFSKIALCEIDNHSHKSFSEQESYYENFQTIIPRNEKHKNKKTPSRRDILNVIYIQE